MNFKQDIIQQYTVLLNTKITTLQHILNELNESAKNETKSSVGDKHETALAMLQIEQENTAQKLKEATTQKLQFQQIDFKQSSDKIIPGSLIKTNHGYLLLCVALGKVSIQNKDIIALSTKSPLGIKLLGAQVKDIIEINKMKYSIEEIE